MKKITGRGIPWNTLNHGAALLAAGNSGNKPLSPSLMALQVAPCGAVFNATPELWVFTGQNCMRQEEKKRNKGKTKCLLIRAQFSITVASSPPLPGRL